MKKVLLLLVITFISTTIYASQPYESLWTSLLQSHTKKATKHHIKTVLVDYKTLRQSQTFATVIRQLENTQLSILKTKEEKLAFWINAYNIGAIKLIIDHDPVKSIKDLGSIVSPIWKKPVLFFEDKPYSLDHIEHKILRLLKEPRIHFAIVCASISCPDLRREAYTAAKIDAQLDEQTRLFLQKERKGLSYNGSTKVVRLSRLFKWFASDFDEADGVPSFVNTYSDKTIIFGSLLYLPYNWKLNSY